MAYRLIAKRWRKVEVSHNDKGEALHHATRYSKGDIIEDISEKDAERLLKAGAIEAYDPDAEDVDGEDAEDSTPEGEDVNPENPDALVTDDEGNPIITKQASEENPEEDSEDVEPQDGSEDSGDATEDSEEDDAEQAPEDYEEWSYPDLQQEAKGRGLNAGGGAADIRERLIEDDAAKRDASQ